MSKNIFDTIGSNLKIPNLELTEPPDIIMHVWNFWQSETCFFYSRLARKKNWFLFILCRYRYLICWAKKEKVDDDDFQFCAKNWLIRNSIACAKITKLTKIHIICNDYIYMLGKFIELFAPATCIQSEKRIYFTIFFRF